MTAPMPAPAPTVLGSIANAATGTDQGWRATATRFAFGVAVGLVAHAFVGMLRWLRAPGLPSAPRS